MTGSKQLLRQGEPRRASAFCIIELYGFLDVSWDSAGPLIAVGLVNILVLGGRQEFCWTSNSCRIGQSMGFRGSARILLDL
jgi:hypothetical protein